MMSYLQPPRPGAGAFVNVRCLAACLLLLSLAACSSLGAGGPSGRVVRAADNRIVQQAQIKVIDVNDAVTRQLLAGYRSAGFAETLGDAPLPWTIIGRGDVLDVSIWEAPPAV